MFISGTVDMTQQASAKMLSLGLGGGNLNSYLHHNYPNVRKDEHNSCRIRSSNAEHFKEMVRSEIRRHASDLADGLNSLKQAAIKGEKYDVILLDACGPDNALLFICPADAFVGINMAKNFSKLLDKNGKFHTMRY
ncbi:unnamed protein product [Strongylus vulgaris]|uniref:PABS domain-containing protein n=1 Tax=Strongylus vulgaris TaxID=40348 RepID=A0A3P7JF72_STRVU|nr:unnamed protein product [Strongylus vulgaris]